MENGVAIIGAKKADAVDLSSFPDGWAIVGDGNNEYIGKLATKPDRLGGMPREWRLEPAYLFLFMFMPTERGLEFERKALPLYGFPRLRTKTILEPRSVTYIDRDVGEHGQRVLRACVELAEKLHDQLAAMAAGISIAQPGQMPGVRPR